VGYLVRKLVLLVWILHRNQLLIVYFSFFIDPKFYKRGRGEWRINIYLFHIFFILTILEEEKKSTKSERAEEKHSESSSAQPSSTNNSNYNSISSQPSSTNNSNYNSVASQPTSEASNDDKKPEIEKKKSQESIIDKL
jgi:hypothetical protein